MPRRGLRPEGRGDNLLGRSQRHLGGPETGDEGANQGPGDLPPGFRPEKESTCFGASERPDRLPNPLQKWEELRPHLCEWDNPALAVNLQSPGEHLRLMTKTIVIADRGLVFGGKLTGVCAPPVLPVPRRLPYDLLGVWALSKIVSWVPVNGALGPRTPRPGRVSNRPIL